MRAGWAPGLRFPSFPEFSSRRCLVWRDADEQPQNHSDQCKERSGGKCGQPAEMVEQQADQRREKPREIPAGVHHTGCGGGMGARDVSGCSPEGPFRELGETKAK